MRFHQGVAFLETDQLVAFAQATDTMGYAGITISDHLFFPRELRSRYPYSPAGDGAPVWPPEADWPDAWCLASAMASVTTRLVFTTNAYIAPARDLYTVAKAVATAAVLSGGRVQLGVAAGWCREEYAGTGQAFTTRGRRLDDMIPALRAIWAGGWVSYQGPHFDVPELQMNPAPPAPIPILCGGHSEAALRRAATLADGWLGAEVYQPDEALRHVADLHRRLAEAGRSADDFKVFVAVAAPPDVGLYRRLHEGGVTDLICAPWMIADADDAGGFRSSLQQKIDAASRFADTVIGAM